MGRPPKGPTKKELGLPVGMGYGMQLSHLRGAKWENVERLARSMGIDLKEVRRVSLIGSGPDYRETVRLTIYRTLKEAWRKRWG